MESLRQFSAALFFVVTVKLDPNNLYTILAAKVTDMTTDGGKASESSAGKSIRPMAGQIAPSSAFRSATWLKLSGSSAGQHLRRLDHETRRLIHLFPRDAAKPSGAQERASKNLRPRSGMRRL
jgi:hypothetical protein